MAARLCRVSRFYSADTLLQPLTIHKVWLRACAASRRKITRRMRFYSADTLLQPLAIHKVWLRACAASRQKITRRMRFFSADTLLQPLAIHKVWLRTCAASRRKITRRMRFYSADILLQPLAALLFYCRAGPACPAVECTSGGGTHGSRPTGLFAGGYGVPRALTPSPPRAAWHCGRGDCVPAPPRRRRWACGSPAAAWASCRTRTPGTPAGRCSRWPAPAWFS